MASQKIKGIKILVHPDFYNLMNKERLKFEAKGVKVSQKDITKLYANKINATEGIINYAKNKKTKKK